MFMSVKVTIVKRRGHQEKFDERKVYASVYAACLATHRDERKSEKHAREISAGVKDWLKNKETITSDEIFEKVIELFEKYDKLAAFLYKTHRDIS